MRFKLHFSALGIADNQPENAIIYSYQKTVFVNLKDNAKGDVFIYNIAGQLVASMPSASGMNRIELVNMGNYIVKVVKEKNAVVRKVFVK
ncbi:MAG: T9SS type A sorting domain-containing protein, partial [Bacteroidota bacterium]